AGPYAGQRHGGDCAGHAAVRRRGRPAFPGGARRRAGDVAPDRGAGRDRSGCAGRRGGRADDRYGRQDPGHRGTRPVREPGRRGGHVADPRRVDRWLGARRRRLGLLPSGGARRRDARRAPRPARPGVARRVVGQLRDRHGGRPERRAVLCRTHRPGTAGARLVQTDPPLSRVRSLELADAPACDAIIASLPDWFGLDEGIRECAAAVRSEPGLVFERDGAVVGFLTVVRPTPVSAEISWLAVHADDRGHGARTALVTTLLDELAAAGNGP